MKLRIDKVEEKSGEYLVLHKWKYRDEKSEKDFKDRWHRNLICWTYYIAL